jgi:hypothetical protein
MYMLDAEGIRDEELIEEVGYGLYVRCLSILEVTDAVKGRVKCRGCGRMIPHASPGNQVLRCCGCGWEIAWRTYQKSYQGKQLHGGAALGLFEEFVERFPLARDPRDRLLLIDRLIHAFHWNLTRRDPAPRRGRPTAANLIEGETIRDMVTFLDELAGRTSRDSDCG